MDCAAFQEKLPHLMESGADLDAEPHLRECQSCADLVRDLRYIAEQAKLLLPLHDPSPKVWENIKSTLSNENDSAAGAAKKKSDMGKALAQAAGSALNALSNLLSLR
jgi:hypothetical protein